MRDFERQMREIVTRAFNAGYDDDQEGVMDMDVDAVDLLRKAVAAERNALSRAESAITEGDVDSVAKEIAKALPEVTDLYSRINPILRRALHSRQHGEQRGRGGADIISRQRCGSDYPALRFYMLSSPTDEWRLWATFTHEPVLGHVSYPPCTEDTNQQGQSDG